jgi:hypothetical protein
MAMGIVMEFSPFMIGDVNSWVLIRDKLVFRPSFSVLNRKIVNVKDENLCLEPRTRN